MGLFGSGNTMNMIHQDGLPGYSKGTAMDQKVIILIDTGIDKSAFEDCIVGGIHFFAEDHCIRCDEDFDDDISEGTPQYGSVL